MEMSITASKKNGKCTIDQSYVCRNTHLLSSQIPTLNFHLLVDVDFMDVDANRTFALQHFQRLDWMAYFFHDRRWITNHFQESCLSNPFLSNDKQLGEQEGEIDRRFLLQPEDVSHEKKPAGTGMFGVVYKGKWNDANKSISSDSNSKMVIVLAVKKPKGGEKVDKIDVQSWKEEAYIMRFGNNLLFGF